MEEITAYRTFDNKIFESGKKAEEHEMNSVYEKVEKRLNSLHESSRRFSKADLYKIITTLFPDHQKSQELVEELLNILD